MEILFVMKSNVLLCYLLSVGMAVVISEKQIKLEDIERDMLQSERKVKDERQERRLSQDITPPQPQYTTGVTQAILRKQGQPKMQYGFVPIRTPEHYVHPPAQEQQQYNVAHAQPQYYTQQYPAQQYAPQQFYQPQYQEQQSEPQQQQQPQYVQYDNVPYIVDNSIGQNSQYYQPQQQYIYLQPYSAASNNIHSVVDAKGNIQYIMYVPASYLSEKQIAEYENSVIPPYEQTQVDAPAQQQVEYQYVPESQAPKHVTQAQYVSDPKSAIKYTKVQYEVPQINQNQIAAPVFKKEPKSLLDSYVPSILQYQLYKQHQAAELKHRFQLGASGGSYPPHE